MDVEESDPLPRGPLSLIRGEVCEGNESGSQSKVR